MSSASRHQSCAAGSTTAAMLLRNMQSDGTAQVLVVCMIWYTTRERKARAAPGAGCRLQIADCRLQVTGAWNLRPTGDVILPFNMNSEWINGADRWTDDGPHAHAENPGTADQARKDENSTHARVGCSSTKSPPTLGRFLWTAVSQFKEQDPKLCLCPAPTHIWKKSLSLRHVG